METLRIIEKTSESLANKHETHIMFAVDKKTESIRIVGDEASVDFFSGNPNVMGHLKHSLLKIHRQQIGQEKLFSMTRLHLFAQPGSKQWKGVDKVRNQLSQLLSLEGYGHKEKKPLGKGNPPKGWPYPYIWEKFSGPSRATFLMNTQIIQGSDIDLKNECNVFKNSCSRSFGSQERWWDCTGGAQ